MKKIGTLENNYHIYQKSAKIFVVQFEVNGHTIAIDNFKYCDWMSEETNCFRADLILDGKTVGECSNEGHGGCANYHCYGNTNEETRNNYALAREISAEVEKVEDYCFPKRHLYFCDVLDNLGSIALMFQENKVASLAKANAVIAYMQETADKYRKRYGE